MMISGVSRTFSLSVARLDVVAFGTAGPASATTITASPVDRVTLSPDATASGAAAAEASRTPSAALPPARSPESSRADALFAALDADRDGAVSEDEFTEGGRRLLQRGRRHAHGHDRDRDRVDGPGHAHGHYGRHGRLERRLERLFDRVDGNGDGTVDRDELSAALTERDSTPAPADGDGAAPTATVAAVRLTVVSVTVSMAVQRYTAVQGAASADGVTPAAGDDRPSDGEGDAQHVTDASPDPPRRADAA